MVKSIFLANSGHVVSVRLVRIALWVCKSLFKVKMQLKYQDICLSLEALELYSVQ